MADYFLSSLVPQTGLMADYPCDDLITTSVSQITDYSGNNKHLYPEDSGGSPLNQPVSLNANNRHPAVYHDSTTRLIASGSFNAKHIFMCVKYDLAANFGGSYRGLLSAPTGTTVWVGDNAAASTKFYNNSFGGSYTYKKNRTAYTESNQQAPFTNYAVIEGIHTGGFGMTNLQVGQQTTFTTRLWRGRWVDLKLYSAVISGNDLRMLRLYYDLKHLMFVTAGTQLEFPDPTMTGIYWSRFKKRPLQWEKVTDTYEYADGSMDFNERTTTPPIEWEIGFTGLSAQQLQIFDTFNEVARRSRVFTLVDKFGVTQTGVRIKSYESDHDAHKSWNNSVNFILCKYP